MWWFNVVGSLGTGTVPRYLVPTGTVPGTGTYLRYREP